MWLNEKRQGCSAHSLEWMRFFSMTRFFSGYAPSTMRTNTISYCTYTFVLDVDALIFLEKEANHLIEWEGGSSSHQSPKINEDSLGRLLTPTPIEAMDINDLWMNEMMENNEEIKIVSQSFERRRLKCTRNGWRWSLLKIESIVIMETLFLIVRKLSYTSNFIM